MTVHKEIVSTSRNFRTFGELIDTYQSKVVVQESSSADEYRVWIQSSNDTGFDAATPHLNVEQAKEVIEMLQLFVDWQSVRWPTVEGALDE